MTEERLSLGKWGEEEAVRHLRRQGMKILERNVRTPVGEIDIVAKQGKCLVFVEVKTRRSRIFGLPQEAVTSFKQRQIIRAAQWFLGDLKNRKWSGLQPRFDVVAVYSERSGSRMEHIPDAFGL